MKMLQLTYVKLAMLIVELAKDQITTTVILAVKVNSQKELPVSLLAQQENSEMLLLINALTVTKHAQLVPDQWTINV